MRTTARTGHAWVQNTPPHLSETHLSRTSQLAPGCHDPEPPSPYQSSGSMTARASACQGAEKAFGELSLTCRFYEITFVFRASGASSLQHWPVERHGTDIELSYSSPKSFGSTLHRRFLPRPKASYFFPSVLSWAGPPGRAFASKDTGSGRSLRKY